MGDKIKSYGQTKEQATDNLVKIKPFNAISDQEHIALILKLKDLGIIGKHIDGYLDYDWDEVLNIIHEKYLKNDDTITAELYQKIQKHYYYLKTTSIRFFNLQDHKKYQSQSNGN